MSEAAPEPPPDNAPQNPPPRPAPILSGWRGAVAIGFATALIVFGVLVITGPFWAPAISPLFSTASAPSADAPLADRLAQLEAAQRDNQQKIDQTVAAAQKAAADSVASVRSSTAGSPLSKTGPRHRRMNWPSCASSCRRLKTAPPRRRAISPNCGNR